MESMNSKEKSKKLWEFIFIFFALALLPVGALFYTFYKVPMALSESESNKLITYSNFDKTQNTLVKYISDIDSNFTLLANENSSLEPSSLFTKITNANLKMQEADTSKLVILVAKMVDNHTSHMNALLRFRKDFKDVKEKNTELKEQKASQQMAPAMGGGGGAPAPYQDNGAPSRDDLK
jgi:predicted ABC-type exoprotein transport system permease subunit